MKKIALVTCYYQHNYGSMLQAFATQVYFDNINIPNETICIDGFKDKLRKKKLCYFISKILSIDVILDKKGTVKQYLAKKLYKEYRDNANKRVSAFDTFITKHFRLSKKYNAITDITMHADEYLAFIVGSDQVWLPSNISADYYTLNFVPKNISKIAYASSFGITALPKKQSEKAKQFLTRFQALSVREQAGKELVKSLIGKDVPIVVDPTLLLKKEQWQSLITNERIINEQYIFCYFLGNNQLPRKFAYRLKKETGLIIVSLLHLDTYIESDERLADIAPYNISPFDFINLIKNADYICTDSFHGTALSIQFEKKFFTFNRFKTNSTMSTNNRLDSLLKLFSLESRLINNIDIFYDLINKDIDYIPVKEKLNERRNYSIDYIKQSLQDLIR